eukprot:353182-Chlamydomonas_euryale.AAC.33
MVLGLSDCVCVHTTLADWSRGIRPERGRADAGGARMQGAAERTGCMENAYRPVARRRGHFRGSGERGPGRNRDSGKVRKGIGVAPCPRLCIRQERHVCVMWPATASWRSAHCYSGWKQRCPQVVHKSALHSSHPYTFAHLTVDLQAAAGAAAAAAAAAASINSLFHVHKKQSGFPHMVQRPSDAQTEDEIEAARWLPLPEYIAQDTFKAPLYAAMSERMLAYARGQNLGMQSAKLPAYTPFSGRKREDVLIWACDANVAAL